MIAKQEAKIEQATDENQKLQTIAELYSTLVGLKSVYNMILEVEKNGYSVSDEVIERMQSEQPHSTRMGITLDEAIKAHIKKQRKFLHPMNSEALISDINLHIKTIREGAERSDHAGEANNHEEKGKGARAGRYQNTRVVERN